MRYVLSTACLQSHFDHVLHSVCLSCCVYLDSHFTLGLSYCRIFPSQSHCQSRLLPCHRMPWNPSQKFEPCSDEILENTAFTLLVRSLRRLASPPPLLSSPPLLLSTSPSLLRFSSPPLLLSTSTPVLLSFSPPPSLLLPCSPPLLLVSSPTLLHSTFNLCRSRPPSSRALSVSCFPLRWAIASRHCARLRSRGPKHPSGTLCWKPPCPKRSRRQVCACTRTSPLCELELCDSCFCVVEEV